MNKSFPDTRRDMRFYFYDAEQCRTINTCTDFFLLSVLLDTQHVSLQYWLLFSQLVFFSVCLTGWRLQWTLGRADKMPGGRVNTRVRGQVRQLVLRAGPYWLTATRTTPCCYISHVDTVSKQNNLPLHPKHTQAVHRILARISGQDKGISRSDWEQQKKFGFLICVSRLFPTQPSFVST